MLTREQYEKLSVKSLYSRIQAAGIAKVVGINSRSKKAVMIDALVNHYEDMDISPEPMTEREKDEEFERIERIKDAGAARKKAAPKRRAKPKAKAKAKPKTAAKPKPKVETKAKPKKMPLAERLEMFATEIGDTAVAMKAEVSIPTPLGRVYVVPKSNCVTVRIYVKGRARTTASSFLTSTHGEMTSSHPQADIWELNWSEAVKAVRGLL